MIEITLQKSKIKINYNNVSKNNLTDVLSYLIDV